MDAEMREIIRDGDDAGSLMSTLRSRASECGTCGGSVPRGDQARPHAGLILRVTDRLPPTFQVDGLEEQLPFCPRCASLTLVERARLAAFCGNEAAREVFGSTGEFILTLSGHGGLLTWDKLDELPLGNWVRCLSRWGHPTLVRAGLIAFRELVNRMGRHEGHQSRRALALVQSWLLCPSKKHQDSAVQACADLANTRDTFMYLGLLVRGMSPVMDTIGVIRGTLAAVSESQVRPKIQAELDVWAMFDLTQEEG